MEDRVDPDIRKPVIDTMAAPSPRMAHWRAAAYGLLRRDIALPLAAVVVPLSIIATVAYLNWNAVWTAAETDMRRAALSAAEYSQRASEGYMMTVGRVNDRLRGLTDPQIRASERELGQDLERITGELSQTQLSYVIDRDGKPLLATNLYPVPRSSLKDREYFQALSAAEAPETYISKTFVGRFDGQLLFSIARRRTNTGNPVTPDGFDGVVLVSVSPRVLAEGLTRLLANPTDQMALMRADGFGISSTSGALNDNEPLPQLALDDPFHALAHKGVQSATYVAKTGIPGGEALFAMRAVGNLPLYAVSARPRVQIVAAWEASLRPLLGLGLPATMALFLLSLQVMFDRRRLAERNVSLQRDNVLSFDRLLRAKRYGLMGTFEFDLRSGISRRSSGYMAIHGHEPVEADELHDDWAHRVHPDDRDRAEEEIERALSDESGATDYGQTYRILTRDGETRWIAARGQIDRDTNGHAYMLRGVHVDVTPLRTTEMALAESNARLRLAQEAMGIGAWEWAGPTQPMRCSRKALELFGFNEASGPLRLRNLLERVHQEDRGTMAKALQEMRATGSLNAEVRLQRPTHTASDSQIWVALRARTVRSRSLGGSRLMGVVFDITERKRSEEMIVLMAHEAEHRAKNALTVVASLLRTTKADSAEELARVMGGRVRALSQTMALLGNQKWTGADLRDIVENELRAFILNETGTNYVITISGPHVRINVTAAQPLSMALYELATNAAKYGALSVAGGRLNVSWTQEGGDVHIRWQERGGPTVIEPKVQGFGSRLIAIVFEGQIGGRLQKSWDPDGLTCDMVLPASSVAQEQPTV